MSSSLVALALALLAGVCSGLWPIALKLSGLNGPYMPLVFVTGGVIAAIPFALLAFTVAKTPIGDIQWGYLLLSAAFCGGVLLLIAGMLAITQSNQIGTYLMIWSITQVTVAAVYTALMTGLSPRLVIGFFAAVIAVIALANR